MGNIRNKFAHDYPDGVDNNAAQTNVALESAMDLYDMLTTVAAKLHSAYPGPEPGNPRTGEVALAGNRQHGGRLGQPVESRGRHDQDGPRPLLLMA